MKDGKLDEGTFQRLVDESQRQGQPFLTLLLSLKEVQAADVAKARGSLLEIPYIDLKEINIKNEDLNFISRNAAENFRIISFEKEDDIVRFAMVDPEDFKALEAVDFLTKRNNLKAEIYITTDASFEAAVTQYETLKKEVGAFIEKAEFEFDEDKTEGLSEDEVEKMVQEAPISKAVNVIMTHAVEGRASDVHIEPMEKETRVRYRVDGVLHTSLTLPQKIHPAVVARIKVLSKLKIDERRVPQDGRFLMRVDNKQIDVRVSTLPLAGGEKVVMRLLDRSKGALTLEELGFEGRSMKIIKENIKEPYGMLLVTGPTGSGKSTTLYSILSLLNKDGVNIVTMEDPVEYYMPGVNQSQIRPDVGLTFASGLRSILRQDPDIIMVGEIRDKETAEMAVHSALTGHFLFSTLHTNSAVGAIPRLVDMGIEKFLLSASLSTLVAQRLVRRICEKCKEKTEVAEGLKEKIEKIVADMPEKAKNNVDLASATYYKGQGCQSCGQEGYRGRVGLFEVLDVNDRIKKAVLDNASNAEIMAIAKEGQGMLTMEQAGVIKVLEGETTVEELLRVI